MLLNKPLALSVIWFPATNAVGSNNGQFTVTLPASDGPRFFRLGAP